MFNWLTTEPSNEATPNVQIAADPPSTPPPGIINWDVLTDTGNKFVSELGSVNEKIKSDFSKGISTIAKANRDIGKSIFESAEAAIQDALIAQNIETMKALAQELIDFITEAPFSCRVQGFLASVIVLLCSLVSFIFNMLNANVLIGLVYLVFVVASLLFALIEYKPFFLPSRIRNWLTDELRFVIRPSYGKPITLHFAAIFIISQSDIVSKMGIESLSCGVLVYLMSSWVIIRTICNSYAVHQQLVAMRDLNVDYATLSKKFNAANKLMTGDQLSSDEFVCFLKSIDYEMDFDNLASTLLELDQNGDGLVSWEEFIYWYEEKVDQRVLMSDEGDALYQAV